LSSSAAKQTTQNKVVTSSKSSWWIESLLNKGVEDKFCKCLLDGSIYNGTVKKAKISCNHFAVPTKKASAFSTLLCLECAFSL
jgi:hypothetical protein